MKEPTHSDRQFQQKLESHVPPAIPEELQWEAISGDLLENLAIARKKRRNWRWIWLIPFFLLVGLGTTWLLFLPPSNPLAPASRISQEKAPPHKNSSPSTSRETENLPVPSPQPLPTLDSKVNSATPQSTRGTQPEPFAQIDPTVFFSTDTTPNKGMGKSQVLAVSKWTPPYHNKLGPDSISPLPLNPVLFSPKLPRTAQPAWSLLVLGGINQWSPPYGQGVSPFEETRTGWVGGLRLQRSLSPHGMIQGGIEVSRLRSRYQNQFRAQVTLFRPGTLDTIFVSRQTGDSSFVFTDSVPGIRRVSIRQHNWHYAVKIPLLVGFQLPLKSGTLSLQSGPLVQLYRASSGIIGWETQELIAVEREKLSEIGINLGIQGEIQFAVPIGKKWNFVMHVAGEKSLSDWNRNQDGLPVFKPAVVSGRLGLAYELDSNRETP